MMSDEERVGDKYVRHPPSYRSDRFNRFLEKLDSRLEKTKTTHHARHERVSGSPVEKLPPVAAKGWMVKDADMETEDNPSEGESFGVSEDDN